MSNTGSKKLLFIKGPTDQLKSVESFLAKRNFSVYSEIDVKTASSKIMEIEPDFIFLAWDHIDPAIMGLPKLIAQASNAIVVPFTTSTKRESTRKLNVCQINPKLYPPVSGPAIERLILKAGLKEAEEKARLAETEAKSKSSDNIASMTESVLTHLKSNPLTGTSNNLSEVSIQNLNKNSINDSTSENSESPESLAKQEAQEVQIRNTSINKRNSILSRPKKLNLSNEAIDNLKKSVQDKVTQPLESLLTTLQESEEQTHSTQNQSNHQIQKTKNQPNTNGGAIIQEGLKSNQNLGTIVLKDNYKSITSEQVVQDSANSINPNQSTHQKIEKTRCYCMSLYSENWCGYLLICIDIELDFSSADIIFTEWIKHHFNNLQEVDEYDYFEFKTIDFNLISKLITKADYSESLKINDCVLKVSFFPVDPKKMSLDMNEEQNLIKISTDEISCDTELNFSLHLHLPENKKYLNYLPVNSTLSADKKKRLLSNKVFFLYIPLSFEKEYRRYLAENIIKLYYKDLQQKENASL